jgi:hypothetical protein
MLSPSAIADADFLSRCGIAAEADSLVIPCIAKELDTSRLPTRLRSLSSISFTGGFAAGLRSVIACFDANGIRPTLTSEQGKSIALRSYMPQPVTRAVAERVYANAFAVAVPGGIQVCDLSRELTEEEETLIRRKWAYSNASPTMLLAFDDPPSALPIAGSGRLPAYDWTFYKYIHGKCSIDIVKELIRRSLHVACARAGLAWCDDRRVFYFPHENKPQRTVSFVHVDGRNTWVAVTGEKSYGSGEDAVPFRYQLSPGFRVGFDSDGKWWVTLRIYVRITDREGKPHEGKAIIRRRKNVTKSWWNKEWFARTLGTIQALAQGNDRIIVGSGDRQVSVSTTPLSWDCPVSIDYRAVELVGDFQEEMAELRYVDAEEDSPDEHDDEEDSA